MTVQLSFLLIFTGLTGIHSITTVSKVSVRAGGTITIPCLYESHYINHVKYFCKGSTWASCSYEVKTNKPSSSGKFSISDDKKQRVFTVTINDLTEEDTDYYWCVVEINYGPDLGTLFHLSVTGAKSPATPEPVKHTTEPVKHTTEPVKHTTEPVKHTTSSAHQPLSTVEVEHQRHIERLSRVLRRDVIGLDFVASCQSPSARPSTGDACLGRA
ncbi:hypothetical protein JOQ06_020774 [Pogonophryne albipinna]|uniref:Immunoglobulin domain-containing protein n=1 Tax=Pogonophryne albipinna TaxID=1090488 RepID=A0AAD6BU16_9TELE|nr:hypothetical protein JOQ06_020774 [Pogonophryne albipinna]